MQIKSKLKSLIKKVLYKKGLKTDRQIIIFESDDWGAVRNPNKENISVLRKEFPNLKVDSYTSFDCIENQEDIILLKNILNSHTDSKGKVAKFTLNFATANPDFERIKASGYNEFHYTMLDKNEEYQNVLNEIKLGINNGCFFPQLHSREHLNSKFLLDDLKNNSCVRRAFELNIVGVADDNYNGLDTLNSEDNEKLLTEAMTSFENLFGYKSTTFIAPCYVWNTKDEEVLSSLGVKALQGKIFQNVPINRDKYKKKYHKFGSVNKATGLKYFSRNCFFEPSKSRLEGKSNNEIIENIIREIDFAFSCKKPAIICTHRVNYVSGIDESNREENLKCLNELLTKIKEKYSNVEFMSTDEFYKGITDEKKN